MKKRAQAILIGVVVVIILVVGLGVFFISSPGNKNENPQNNTTYYEGNSDSGIPSEFQMSLKVDIDEGAAEGRVTYYVKGDKFKEEVTNENGVVDRIFLSISNGDYQCYDIYADGKWKCVDNDPNVKMYKRAISVKQIFEGYKSEAIDYKTSVSDSVFNLPAGYVLVESLYV